MQGHCCHFCHLCVFQRFSRIFQRILNILEYSEKKSLAVCFYFAMCMLSVYSRLRVHVTHPNSPRGSCLRESREIRVTRDIRDNRDNLVNQGHQVSGSGRQNSQLLITLQLCLRVDSSFWRVLTSHIVFTGWKLVEFYPQSIRELCNMMEG